MTISIRENFILPFTSTEKEYRSLFSVFGLSKDGIEGVVSNWKEHRVRNGLLKILSYIPVAGTIIGLMNLYEVYKMNYFAGRNDPSMNKNRKIFMDRIVVRNVINSLSLGFLLLVPDIIATIHRKCYPMQPVSFQG